VISTKTGFGSDTYIIFQKQDRIVKIYYPIISGVNIKQESEFKFPVSSGAGAGVTFLEQEKLSLKRDSDHL